MALVHPAAPEAQLHHPVAHQPLLAVIAHPPFLLVVPAMQQVHWYKIVAVNIVALWEDGAHWVARLIHQVPVGPGPRRGHWCVVANNFCCVIKKPTL